MILNRNTKIFKHCTLSGMRLFIIIILIRDYYYYYTERTVLLKFFSKNLTKYRTENNFVGPLK